jgi:hypothetical protein
MISCDIFDHVKYPAQVILNRFADFETNGVLHLTDFALSYPATPNMTANVGAGTALVNGYRIVNDSNPVTLTFATANYTNPRIDLVEVGWSGAGLTGVGVLNIVTGSPASTPIQPQPTAGCIGLFAVKVNANQASITANSVTDLRVAMALIRAVTPFSTLDYWL